MTTNGHRPELFLSMHLVYPSSASDRTMNTRHEVKMALKHVQRLQQDALIELQRRTSVLSQLNDLLDGMRPEEQVTPVAARTQAQTSRRVALAPHPSPLAETPMRTGQTLPVQSMHCRSKWTSPTSEQCGQSVRPSFTAAELQAARAEAWAERMAANQAATLSSGDACECS